MEKFGFLGPLGTHSEEAAIYFESLSPEDARAKLVPYPEISDVLEAVRLGAVDRALVPVENSLEGAINITLDLLARIPALIVKRELIWPVHNHLLAKCAAKDIKSIHSHPQPISQCRHYLHANFSWARLCEEASTAKAAEIVAKNDAKEGMAAIGTRRAAEIYGLNIVASEIQDNAENCTRFYEVRKISPASENNDGDISTAGKIKGNNGSLAAEVTEGRALLICQIDGSRAGSLLEVLQDFACYNVNLTRIESRPARTFLGAYIFFFDLEVDRNLPAIRQAIAAVQKRSIWLRYLGEFPVHVAKL